MIGRRSSVHYSTCGRPSATVVPRLRIRILKISMFLGFLGPHLDPLVTSKDPDPSIIKQYSKKALISTLLFCDFFITFYL